MDVDQESGEAKPKTRKVRKQVKKGDLPVVAVTSSLDQVTKDIYTEKENQMAMEDKLVADTEDRKNALEEYIYDLRNKIEDIWASFASEPEKQRINEMCNAAEVCTSLAYLPLGIQASKPNTAAGVALW